MVSVAGRGRPSLTVTREVFVSTASRTDGGADGARSEDGAGRCAGRCAGCGAGCGADSVDRLADSPQETSNAAATDKTTVVGRAPAAISPPYDGYRDSQPPT